MLEIQKYLKSGKTLSNLNDELGIKVKDYPEDGIVLLDYDQINSPKSHPIVIECRSLILHRETFDVISRKYDRFFNYGECPEYYADFDYSQSIAFEKADGSLIGIYWNPLTKVWEISTRGMAKAEGDHYLGGTFREKVISAGGWTSEEAFQKYCNYEMRPDLTYIFEFISPENQIVTRYQKPELVLTGITFNHDGLGVNFRGLEKWAASFIESGLSVRLPKIYSLTENISELVAVANSLKNLEEGFVVWDHSSGKRVKIKSASYLVAHKLRGNDPIPTRKNLLQLVLEGEVDEFLAYFPDWKKYVDPIVAEVGEFESRLTNVWNGTKHIQDQKEFALSIKDVIGSSVLFQSKKSMVDPVKTFHSMDLNKKMRLFGV